MHHSPSFSKLHYFALRIVNLQNGHSKAVPLHVFTTTLTAQKKQYTHQPTSSPHYTSHTNKQGNKKIPFPQSPLPLKLPTTSSIPPHPHHLSKTSTNYSCKHSYHHHTQKARHNNLPHRTPHQTARCTRHHYPYPPQYRPPRHT